MRNAQGLRGHSPWAQGAREQVPRRHRGERRHGTARWRSVCATVAVVTMVGALAAACGPDDEVSGNAEAATSTGSTSSTSSTGSTTSTSSSGDYGHAAGDSLRSAQADESGAPMTGSTLGDPPTMPSTTSTPAPTTTSPPPTTTASTPAPTNPPSATGCGSHCTGIIVETFYAEGASPHTSAPTTRTCTTLATPVTDTDGNTVVPCGQGTGGQGSGGSCLPGDWIISQSDLQHYYNMASIGVSVVAGFSMTVDGNMGITFHNGVVTFIPHFSLSVTVDTTTASATQTGTATATYSTDNGTLNTSNYQNNVTIHAAVNGTPTPAHNMDDASATAQNPVNGVPYSCTADGPVIMFDSAGDLVPMHLTPAA